MSLPEIALKIAIFTLFIYIKNMSDLTKRAFEVSLKKLLREKSLNKITIQELADDCHVNRMTFYYHFKDIYELVEWCCLEDAKKYLEEKNSYAIWKDSFLRIFKGLQEDKIFIISVNHSIGREFLENYLFSITYKLLMDVVEERACGIDIDMKDKEFIAGFYKYAFVGTVLEWIKNDMSEKPEKIISHIDILLEGDIDKAIKKFKK